MISSVAIQHYAPSARQTVVNLEPGQFVVEIDCRGTDAIRMIDAAGPHLMRENTKWYRFTRGGLLLAKSDLQGTTGVVQLRYGYKVAIARTSPRLGATELQALSLSHLGDLRHFEAYLESEARSLFLRRIRGLREHEQAIQALDQLIDMPVVYYPELMLDYSQRKTAAQNICDSLMAALATFCDDWVPLCGGLAEVMFWTDRAELETKLTTRFVLMEEAIRQCLAEYREHVREREAASQKKLGLILEFLRGYQPDIASLGPLVREFLPLLGPQVIPDHVGDAGRRVGAPISHSVMMQAAPADPQGSAGNAMPDSIRLSAVAAGLVLSAKLQQGVPVVDAMAQSLNSVEIRTRRNKSLSDNDKDRCLRDWLDNNAGALEQSVAQRLLSEFLVALSHQHYVVEPAGETGV